MIERYRRLEQTLQSNWRRVEAGLRGLLYAPSSTLIFGGLVGTSLELRDRANN